MTTPRLEVMRALVARTPDSAPARFGLANEAAKAGLYEEAHEQLTQYLTLADDEGNAYGRLADVLVRLDRPDEAREALVRGIAASQRFGHPSMAAEFEARLEELDDA